MNFLGYDWEPFWNLGGMGEFSIINSELVSMTDADKETVMKQLKRPKYFQFEGKRYVTVEAYYTKVSTFLFDATWAPTFLAVPA